MEEIIKNVSVGLLRRGFARRHNNNWVWRNIVVIYREQDSSFLGYQKTTEHEEWEFFDFGLDEINNHFQFVLLVSWAEARQKLARINLEQVAA